MSTITLITTSICAVVIPAISAVSYVIKARTAQRKEAKINAENNAICALAEHDAYNMYMDALVQGNPMRSTRANVRAMLRNRYNLKPMYIHIAQQKAYNRATSNSPRQIKQHIINQSSSPICNQLQSRVNG